MSHTMYQLVFRLVWYGGMSLFIPFFIFVNEMNLVFLVFAFLDPSLFVSILFHEALSTGFVHKLVL
ncbi:hypothetical protein RchiOBHm_Chr1g0360051 [Rosa chinensis]|uniref:Uncharacterized protein n=1 Tax=Rosa chinensis TaxID=74649 RepID=A0A2P6SIJ8_ROSCH|nr:hypothetical protein RchiOBHm_Chr1g0360051 [Rosa chinensis]